MTPVKKSLFRLDGRGPTFQWAAVVVVSAVLAAVIYAARLPAHHLLGGMGAGLAAALLGATVRMPKQIIYFGLCVVCAMIARTMSPSTLDDIAGNWPIFVLMVILVVVVSSLMGWLLAKTGMFPGSTAVWGTSPGAPTTMTILSEKYGADARLVAFLQYSRVMVVAVVSSLVAYCFGETRVAVAVAGDWFPPVYWAGFFQTIALCLFATIVCVKAGSPMWAIVIPMFCGTILHHAGVMTIELPWWFETLAYGAVGIGIGLRFTWQIVVHALRSLPKVLASIFITLAVCSVFGLFFYSMIGIDPLSAYFAASPVGMDCIAIIASTLDVNMSFIMAVHISRLFVVVTLGPSIAIFIAKRMGAQEMKTGE